MQQGKIFTVYLIVIAVGILSFLLISSTSPSQDRQISKLYPKTPVKASQSLMINLSSSAISPNSLTINVGETVTWISNDSANHMIMSNSGTFNSPVITPSQNYSYTFDTSGSYSFYDMFFPSLTGTINVVSPTATPAPTQAATNSPTSTPNPTSNSSTSPTSSPIDSATGLFLPIPSSMVLATDSPTPRPTRTPKATPTLTPSPTPTPTVLPTPTPTPKPVKKSFFQPVLDFFQSAFNNFLNIFHR